MSEATRAEQMQHVTCRIRTDNSIGTGFFYSMEFPDGNRLEHTLKVCMLVTNRHVIADSETTFFNLTASKEDGSSEFGSPEFGKSIPYKIPTKNWILHPNNEIDLAILPVTHLLTPGSPDYKKPFYKTITQSHIADNEYLANMDAIENIIMVGYPKGLYDEANNLPIFRSGITASRIGLKFNGKPEFLIDCACINGSSGSPVFQYEDGLKTNRNGQVVVGGQVTFKFLGILYGGPIMTLDGDIVAEQIETAMQVKAKTNVMINLGYCIRASELEELGNVFLSRVDNFVPLYP